MKNVKIENILCRDCGESVPRTSNRQLSCPPCSTKRDRASTKIYHKKTRIKKGHTLKGKSHPLYTTGIEWYRSTLKPTCEFCDLPKKFRCVHHIDENRYNNEDDNLATLCRRCHTLVHGLDTRRGSDGKFIKRSK